MFCVSCPRNMSLPLELKQSDILSTLLRDSPRRNGIILYGNMREYFGTALRNEVVNKVSLTVRGFH